jgi:hypothetical protein
LCSHALAPVAELPVLQVLSAKHVVADLNPRAWHCGPRLSVREPGRPTTRDRL